jgi:hypothetical protein
MAISEDIFEDEYEAIPQKTIPPPLKDIYPSN